MCAIMTWGAHEYFMHPIFVLKNGCDSYPNRVMILNSGRESNNKIHTYFLPFPSQNKKWLKQSSFHVHCFNSTANITPSNICSYLFPHLGQQRSPCQGDSELGQQRLTYDLKHGQQRSPCQGDSELGDYNP
jgi:hypothetical protein